MDYSTPRCSRSGSPEMSVEPIHGAKKNFAKRTKPFASDDLDDNEKPSKHSHHSTSTDSTHSNENRLRPRPKRSTARLPAVRRSVREKKRTEKFTEQSVNHRRAYGYSYDESSSRSRTHSQSSSGKLQSRSHDRCSSSEYAASEYEEETEDCPTSPSPNPVRRVLRSAKSIKMKHTWIAVEGSSRITYINDKPRRNPARTGRPDNFANITHVLAVNDADSSRDGSEPMPKKKKTKLSNSGSKGIPSASTNSFEPTIYFPEEGSISFDTVGGYDAVKEELRRSVIAPFRRLIYQAESNKDASQPTKVAQVAKGALFWGPPGTGKTLMAKALAYECGRQLSRPIPVYIISGAELLTKWVGESESHLRAVFHHASENSPSIIFMDELDGLVRRRTTAENDSANFNMVSTLLTLLNGVTDRGAVLALATTNFRDVLDPALLRSGRFDTKIHFPAPDKNERKLILEALTQKWLKKLVSADAFTLAKNTEGFTGADLDLLCRKAQNHALQRHEKPDDFDLDKLEVGLPDFFSAWTGMEPSGQAVTASLYQPLLPILQPLLSDALDSICTAVAQKYPMRFPQITDEEQICNTAAWAAFTHPSLMLDYDPMVFIYSDGDPLILEIVVGAFLARIAEKYTVRVYDFRTVALGNRIEHDLLSLMSDRSSVVALCNLETVCAEKSDKSEIPAHFREVLKNRDKLRSPITVITSIFSPRDFSEESQVVFSSGMLRVLVKPPAMEHISKFFEDLFLKETTQSMRDDGTVISFGEEHRYYVDLLDKLTHSLRKKNLNRLMSVYSELSSIMRQDFKDQRKERFKKLVKKFIDEERQSVQA